MSVFSGQDQFSILNLPQIADEESFLAELKKLIDDGDTAEAIKKAIVAGDEHILWKLGQYCEQNQKFPEAISIYQEISNDNPHYHNANQQALSIIMNYISVSESELSLTQEEKRYYQEAQFKFLLRGNVDSNNQNVIDQHYHQLCGNTDLNPSIINVGCNEETLIALSKQTSSLKNENEALKQKNIEQMKQIAFLTEQLEKLKNKETTEFSYTKTPNTLFAPQQNNIEESSKNANCGLNKGFLNQ